MGIFSELREKQKAERAQRQSIADAHRSRGYDILPGKFRLQILPLLLVRHLLTAAVTGAMTGGLWHVTWGKLSVPSVVLIVLVPAILFVSALRRVVETITCRFDMLGGAVTKFDSETEETWDSEKNRYETHTTYYIELNGIRRRVSPIRSATLKLGDYCLVARYKRRYENRDNVYIFRHKSLIDESARTGQLYPHNELRLDEQAHFSTGVAVLHVVTMVLWYTLHVLYIAMHGKDVSLTSWLMADIGSGIVAAAVLAWGLYGRFQKEKSLLEEKRIRLQAYMKKEV